MDMDMDVHYVSGSQFTNYSPTSVTIYNKEYKTNIVVTNDGVTSFPLTDIKDITFESLENIIEDKPDLIIFGSGDNVIYPDFKVLEKLNRQGIGFEVMPIQALCRTYNYLISESRKVVCILFFSKP